MTGKKPHLELRKEITDGDKYNREEYFLNEVQSGYKIYRGRFYALTKESTHQCALIFDEELPAISGPAGQRQHLLSIGHYPWDERDHFLMEQLCDNAKKCARDLAEKLNLPLIFKDPEKERGRELRELIILRNTLYGWY